MIWRAVLPNQPPRDLILDIYKAALARVNGRRVVVEWLRAHPLRECAWHVVALGKAAEAMALGARDVLDHRIVSGLVVTKKGHVEPGSWDDSRFSLYCAEHPLPGDGSIRAGHALLRFIRMSAPDAKFLFLISGGASSLVEVPLPGVNLDFLYKVNEWLLASGLPIDQVNWVRQRLSRIKGGGLRHYLMNRESMALVISDVPGNNPCAIGSGLLADALPGFPSSNLPAWLAECVDASPEVKATASSVPHYLVASSAQAIDAAVRTARDAGYFAERMSDALSGDAAVKGGDIAALLCNLAPGVFIWGGETTVTLPDNPGRGGRNQHLALAAARILSGRNDCWLMSAGTDGTDGPTDDAGALIDGGTTARGRLQGLDPDQALHQADSGRFLEASGDLIQTGPTGTNVMDLVIALRIGHATNECQYAD